MSRSNETITLTVNTSGITQSNFLSQVTFTDGDGDTLPPNTNATAFNTPLKGGASVTWSAQSSDGVDTIHLLSVAPNDTTTDFFAMGPTGPDDMGNWSARVKGSNPNNDIDCEYTIKFYINGDSSNVFTIDPKLQISKAS